ncbi:site-specific integrase, partial [Acidobacteria bacterium AH-259-D05]|nr:site-specific integrase [Acidobacteria bacterium AH-259-D05]
MGVKVREKIKGSNVWWVFVDHRGLRKAKQCGSKKLANKVAEIMEANLKLGRPLLGEEEKPPVPTLNQYYERFKERYMKTAIKESSRICYESSFKVHTLPDLGKLRLDEISRDEIENFIAVLMGKGLAKDTIRVILAGLRTLLNNAIEKKIIKENPARNVGKLYSQAPTRHEQIEPLTEEESLSFLRATLEHEPGYYPPFLCALHTGLRSGELAGIQWADVDWNSKYIQVSRQIVRGKVTTLKNRQSRRKVDCSDDLLLTLATLKKKCQEEALKRGMNTISEWVFTNDKGDLIDIVNIKSKQFKR